MQFAWSMLQFNNCLLHLNVCANFSRWSKKNFIHSDMAPYLSVERFWKRCSLQVAQQCLKLHNVHRCSLLTVHMAGENSQYSSWLVTAVKLVDVVQTTEVCGSRTIDCWVTIKVLHCVLWVWCICPKQQCYFEYELAF